MPTSTSEGDRLLVLGFGYSARAFVARHGSRFAGITVTTRDPAQARVPDGVCVERLQTGIPMATSLVQAAKSATHVLVSTPPGEGGDPSFVALGETLKGSEMLRWLGYLSTTGVYGDHAGRWIDEDAETMPKSARSRHRLDAENDWLGLAEAGPVVQVFRLSGIYGPGRNALVDLRDGTARRIDKPEQLFNRVHVDDIADVVAAAIDHPDSGPIFNVADDEPAAQHEVVAFAAGLLGLEPPSLIPYEDARSDMSEMALSFWAESKRIRNDRLHSVLGVKLSHPTYREGLAALHEAGEGR
jgi:hypothetical protein